MKRFSVTILVAVALFAPVSHGYAQANENDSAFSSDWSFGLQAAPLMFGLSLRRHINDIWQLQGVLTPDGDESTFGLRVLRTATQKQFWRSYLFAGVAAGRDTETLFDDDTFESTERSFTKAVVTTGLGVEWTWAAKSLSRPPLSWGLELGLGLRNEDYNDTAFTDRDGVFMVVGAGVHYQFE